MHLLIPIWHFRLRFLWSACLDLHHLSLLRELSIFRRNLHLFFLLLIRNLFGYLVNRSSSRTNLILKMIGLVFTDIPFQTKQFVRVGFNIGNWQFVECLQVFEREVSFLDQIQVTFIGDLNINDELILVFSIKYTIDEAKLSPDNCHKWRIVSIFDAFVYHVY